MILTGKDWSAGRKHSNSAAFLQHKSCMWVESSWNVMAHGDARERKWRWNWRMEWVASTLHTTSEHVVSSITTADAHASAASSRMNLINWFVDTLSITIGMNLWFAPQISEHCPYNSPGRLIVNLAWFSRPGVASVFTPRLGTVHECNTSAAVTIIRIGEFIGSTIWLSVSNSRNVLINWSS